MKKTFGWSSIALLVALVVGLPAAEVSAQLPANLGCSPCATPPGPGCGPSFPVAHPSFSSGRFNLAATDLGDDCRGGTCPDMTGVNPPLRMWGLNSYVGNNNGCQDPVGNYWMENLYTYFSAGIAGDWFLYQAQFNGANVDGCPSLSMCPACTEIVVDIAMTDTMSGEGTVMHDSWYLVAAAVNPGSGADFDTIQGGDMLGGDNPAHIPIQSVPDLTGVEAIDCQGGAPVTLTCPNNGMAPDMTGPSNTVDMDYYDVTISSLSDTMPPYLTGMGLNAGTQLIAGMQIVYAEGMAEPTSSDECVQPWLSTRDPADPANNVAGLWPWGAAGPVTVSLPKMTAPHWLAVRIVYTDASLNSQTGPGPEATGPALFTRTGMHCGPVAPACLAVTFASVEAERTPTGIDIRWATSSEDDVSHFTVMRSTSALMENEERAGDYVLAANSSTGSSYDTFDAAVVNDRQTTFYYVVQEWTFSGGRGMRSPVITVPGEGATADPTGVAGGRSRSASRR